MNKRMVVNMGTYTGKVIYWRRDDYDIYDETCHCINILILSDYYRSSADCSDSEFIYILCMPYF